MPGVADFDLSIWTYRARPVRVVDGDTVEVECDTGFGARHLVALRLLGIDAPEMPTPEGLAAADRAAQLVRLATGEWPLRVQTHKLKNGAEARTFARYVGRVWAVGVDGTLTDIGAAMVSDGHASPYPV